jgi:predicted negative regulator of RcsB-dependent stress response
LKILYRSWLTANVLSLACVLVLSVAAVFFYRTRLTKAPQKQDITNVTSYSSKLLGQTHLSSQDDCADVILTTICQNETCQHQVTTVLVVCKEVFEQSSKDFQDL